MLKNPMTISKAMACCEILGLDPAKTSEESVVRLLPRECFVDSADPEEYDAQRLRISYANVRQLNALIGVAPMSGR